MIPWLAACVVLLAGCVAVALWVPFSLSSSLQGKAEPSGSWAVAFGMAFGPVAVTAIAAAQMAPFMTCHVFGKQVVRLPLSRWVKRKKPEPVDGAQPAPAVTFSRAERAVARFVRALDPIDTVLAWWEKERIFEVRSLVVDVEYSFCDIALTGQILAALYMLSGVLPSPFIIHQTPSWESEDRLALAADGRFRIWPGRLLVDLVGFVLDQRARARRSAVAASQ